MDNNINVTPPDNTYWHKIADDLKDIAVGGNNELWGIDKEGDIVKYDRNSQSWKVLAPIPSGDKPDNINCSEDNTLCCVAGLYTFLYNHREDDWDTLGHPYAKSLAFASVNHSYYLGNTIAPNREDGQRGEGTLNKLNFGVHQALNVKENDDSRSFSAISVGIDGTIFGISENHPGKLMRIYNHSDTLYEYQAHYITDNTNYTFKSISVASASQIMAITSDDKILTYIGENQFLEDRKQEWYFDDNSYSWKTSVLTGEIIKVEHNVNSNCYIIVKNGDTYSTYSRVMQG